MTERNSSDINRFSFRFMYSCSCEKYLYYTLYVLCDSRRYWGWLDYFSLYVGAVIIEVYSHITYTHTHICVQLHFTMYIVCYACHPVCHSTTKSEHQPTHMTHLCHIAYYTFKCYIKIQKIPQFIIN